MLNSFLLAVFSVSMFSLLAVSVDRFWAVCYPVTYHVSGTKTTKIIITFCWIFGIFFGFLPTFGWNSGHIDNKCDLRVIADMDYLLFVCVAIAFVSSCAIIVLYALIYRAVIQQVNANFRNILNFHYSILSVGKKTWRDCGEFKWIFETKKWNSSDSHTSDDRWNFHRFMDARNYQFIHHCHH